MNIVTYLRSFRLGPFAIFDFAASFIVVALIAPLLSKLCLKIGLIIPIRSWLFWTVPLAVIVHILVGQQTALTKEILDPKGGYLAKIIVLALFLLGFWGIKLVKK